MIKSAQPKTTKRSRRNKAGFSDAAPKTDRLPPHSIESEQGVLGCCLLSPKDCLDEVEEKTGGVRELFYDLRHQVILDAMMDQHHNKPGTEIDIITIQETLKNWNRLEEVGGLVYLTTLPDTVPSAANLNYYLDIVVEKYRLRKMVHTCTEAVSRIYEHEGEVDLIFDQIERDLLAITEARLPTTARPAKDAVINAMQVISEFRRGHKRKVGPGTGFNYLDNIIPGMAPGDFIILAARPSTGKSALAMQISEHVAEREGAPVAFFSLEMTEQNLMMRQIFTRAGANLVKFNNGFFEERSIPDITRAASDIGKLPIYYDESARMSVEDFEVKLRRMVRLYGIKFAVIDYFQLMYSRRPRQQWSKSDELAYVSMRIKTVAKELKIPILVLAQMNRDIEKDFTRKPRLSDLKDTGQLEQDADIIIFLWKPDVNKESWVKKVERIFQTLQVPEQWKHWEAFKDKDGEWYRPWREYLTIVLATVAKQRNGPADKDATLVFIKEWTRLVDAYTPARTEKKDLVLEQPPETPAPADDVPEELIERQANEAQQEEER